MRSAEQGQLTEVSAPRPSCGSIPSASGLSPGVTAVSRGGGSCSDSAIPAPRPPPQHFVCAKCEKPFLGHRHYEKKGLAYCETHYNQVRLEAGQWDAVLRGASQGGLAGKGMGQPPPLGAPWRVLSGGCAAGLCAECLGTWTAPVTSVSPFGKCALWPGLSWGLSEMRWHVESWALGVTCGKPPPSYQAQQNRPDRAPQDTRGAEGPYRGQHLHLCFLGGGDSDQPSGRGGLGGPGGPGR